MPARMPSRRALRGHRWAVSSAAFLRGSRRARRHADGAAAVRPAGAAHGRHVRPTMGCELCRLLGRGPARTAADRRGRSSPARWTFRSHHLLGACSVGPAAAEALLWVSGSSCTEQAAPIPLPDITTAAACQTTRQRPEVLTNTPESTSSHHDRKQQPNLSVSVYPPPFLSFLTTNLLQSRSALTWPVCL